jgi:hypothetical protein
VSGSLAPGMRGRVRIAIVGVFSALWGSAAAAQPPDPHAALPERPSVATHAHTVAPGWVEIEIGVERPREDARFGDTGVPLSVKLGLTSTAQLVIAPSISRPAGGHTSFESVGIGVKYRITDRAPVLGAIAVLPSVSLPVGNARRTDEDSVGALFITSRVMRAVSLDLNVGYIRRSGDGSQVPVSEALWAAAAGGPLAGRFGWVGEISGSPRTAGPAGRDAEVNLLVGVTAALTPSVVIDLACALPLSGDGSSVVMSGVVWNVGPLWTRRPLVP